MMSVDSLSLDFELCCKQFDEFRRLLAEKPTLSERKDVLPFFRERRQLSALFGMFNPSISWADRIAWEFDIFGDFACDLAVGQWNEGAYCFIEFENADNNSVFQKQGTKATREWGQRFDHGYSQIIDWAYKFDGLAGSREIETRFGMREIRYQGVLVVGRDSFLDAGEQLRLSWRAENVVVNSKK